MRTFCNKNQDDRLRLETKNCENWFPGPALFTVFRDFDLN